MRIEMWFLISLAMFTLAGCAAPSEVSTHFCAVDEVKPSGLGLQVYLQPNASINLLTVNQKGPGGMSTHYSVRKGRVVAPDNPPRPGFHPFAPRHFFLDQRGSADSFNIFGGCSYEIRSDAGGTYLHVVDPGGDTDESVYEENIRPSR